MGRRHLGATLASTSVPLIMHWNGKRWRLVHFAAGSKFGELYGVSALSATDAWAVGFANERRAAPALERP